MAGCFGNNPYDRYMEAQLNRYLDSLEYMYCPTCDRNIHENDFEYDNETGKDLCPYCLTELE